MPRYSENPFDLFPEHPGRVEAEKEIADLIDTFVSNLKVLQLKHKDVGANDTASRRAINEYIAYLKLGMRD